MGTKLLGAGDVLFGKTRQRVLGLLLGHPDEAYYVREILRRTHGAPGAVQRELELLAGAAVLQRTVRGRQVYFQANRASPIFPELRNLVIKTFGVVELIREALTPIVDAIEIAFIFGSAARAELGPASDIDLLVVGDVTFAEVVRVTRPAQQQLGRDVNPTVYTSQEFRQKLEAGHHFLQALVDELRLDVIGDSSELERLGTQRLVDRPHDQRKRGSRPARGRRARSGRQ